KKVKIEGALIRWQLQIPLLDLRTTLSTISNYLSCLAEENGIVLLGTVCFHGGVSKYWAVDLHDGNSFRAWEGKLEQVVGVTVWRDRMFEKTLGAVAIFDLWGQPLQIFSVMNGFYSLVIDPVLDCLVIGRFFVL